MWKIRERLPHDFICPLKVQISQEREMLQIWFTVQSRIRTVVLAASRTLHIIDAKSSSVIFVFQKCCQRFVQSSCGNRGSTTSSGLKSYRSASPFKAIRAELQQCLIRSAMEMYGKKMTEIWKMKQYIYQTISLQGTRKMKQIGEVHNFTTRLFILFVSRHFCLTDTFCLSVMSGPVSVSCA